MMSASERRGGWAQMATMVIDRDDGSPPARPLLTDSPSSVVRVRSGLNGWVEDRSDTDRSLGPVSVVFLPGGVRCYGTRVPTVS